MFDNRSLKIQIYSVSTLSCKMTSLIFIELKKNITLKECYSTGEKCGDPSLRHALSMLSDRALITYVNS